MHERNPPVFVGSGCGEPSSCTDPLCAQHRYDLFAALVEVADCWFDSLPAEPRERRCELERAFVAIAGLAAAEALS